MKKNIFLFATAFLLLIGFVFSTTAQEVYQPLVRCRSGRCGHHRPHPDIIFIPQIIVSKNYQPITIQDLSIKTDILGNVATTTYEIVMKNPNSATLEAEFEFPLAENQSVAAIALDINGNMREGVVVEKEKARKTFEAVVRQGADPLLVEKNSANQFTTRIYPFAPNGTRKIRITLEESLQKENGQYKYVLPLNFKQKLNNFTLDINIPTENIDLPQVATNIPDFHFTKTNHIVQSHFNAINYELDDALSFSIHYTTGSQFFTHKVGNQTYFYGDVDVKKSEKNKVLPKKIAILWDSSLSGNKRNIEKEKELLQEYIKKLNNVTISFIPFNINTDSTKELKIQKGNSAPLMSLIDQIVYDGATRFSKVDIQNLKVDEILLFSDGLNTFGKETSLKFGKTPVYTINSSNEYSVGQLRNWANKNYASFINLTNTDIPKAIEKLTQKPFRVISYNGENISNIYPVIGTEIDENITIAGILNGPSTELEISFGYDANSVIEKKKINIAAEGDNPAVERLWAIQKIAYLEQEADKNKSEILSLGQKYSIVTQNTSLLVLENASDYFRYHITPPADLQHEYDVLQQNEKNSQEQKKRSAWENAKQQAQKVKDWWNRKFDITQIKKEKYQQLHSQGEVVGEVVMEGRAFAANSVSRSSRRSRRGTGESDNVVMEPMGRVVMVDAVMVDSNASVVASVSDKKVLSEPKTSIQIKQWDPDVPYLKILKSSKDNELYEDYLKLKKGYQDQPSFYFDITDEFMKRNQNENALKVLSNIIEMKIDNVELIRIAANKLMQMKYFDYAVELFEKITQLRGEDPQSFRDLALAYQEQGNYQKAFDTFYHILENDWGRFNEIKQIIFVELNNLISLHSEINKKDLDNDFIFDMPVDIRISLAWSTDNTDIDLHVVDPMEEECYYGHKETAIGGRYPHDFTQGFGPEEFMLRRAANGKYIIRTNNFGDHRQSISGPTTLYLDLYTNYSRPNQTHERVLVRTETVKEKNSIGEITWEGTEEDNSVATKSQEEKVDTNVDNIIVSNSDIRGTLPRCGTVSQTEVCVYLILNSKTYDILAEDLFKEVAQKTGRQEYKITVENPTYAKRLIKPGYFAQIKIPAIR